MEARFQLARRVLARPRVVSVQVDEFLPATNVKKRFTAKMPLSYRNKIHEGVHWRS